MEEEINEIAKSFYNKEWGNEKMKVHSEIMMNLCIDMVKDTQLNPDVFIVAGWLHDMGRKIDSEKHEIHSMIFFKKFMSMHPELKEIEEEIKDCIINHRSTGNPTTLHGQIFQVADKLSLKHNNWIIWKKRQQK